MRNGRLRVYLGAAPGVGKTFAMLDEGWRRSGRGSDVVIGCVETHDRPSTVAQIRSLEIVPRRQFSYRGQTFEEMDIDAILARPPGVVLVDELAHTNVPGSRNEKRWQDIDELLDTGFEVISTLNIQHLASLNDAVASITGQPELEMVPDAVVRAADQIELIDMSPEALRRRMAHGNIYAPEKVDTARGHYFRVGNLNALRELALLWVADRVDTELRAYREQCGISQPWETKERVVVALTGAAHGEALIRRGARIAARVNGELVGVHVRAADGRSSRGDAQLDDQRRLLSELGGRFAETTGSDVAATLGRFARAENASQILLGATRRSRWFELVHGSVINRAIREAKGIDVHIVSGTEIPDTVLPRAPRSGRLAALPPARRHAGWALTLIGIPLFTLALAPFRASVGLPGVLLVLLLAVVIVAVVGGAPTALLALAIAFGFGDFFFTHPFGTLRMTRGNEIVALVAFALVAAVVCALVDRLTVRGLQVARSQAEAEALARLAGGSVLSGATALPALVDELRRTFDAEVVAVLEPDNGGWATVAAAGSPVPASPDTADYSAELGQGTKLVLAARSLSDQDLRLLNAFVAQLRIAQEHAELEARASTAGELEEANRLRDSLLAAVSHDLRTPLAAIKAAATCLRSEDIEWSPGEAREFVETIDEETDRLTHLVSNLLDMSRLQAGALRITARSIVLEDVLYSAVGMLGPDSSRVAVDVAASVPLVLVDAGLLESALANVIDNALAWSPKERAVRITAGRVGDHVYIRVIDQGPGVPLVDRERVFTPFQQLGDGAGDRPNSVGLGLAVARGFVEALGGELTLEDTPGGGTTAVFSLESTEP